MSASVHPTMHPLARIDAAPPHRTGSAVGWFGAMAAAICALGVACGVWWLKPHEDVVPTSATAVRVAEMDLIVPTAWLRLAQVAGPVERLDLIVPLPALTDAGAQEDGPVFVTLSRPNGSMNPADRTALLYAGFLTAQATPGVGGLIRREFRSGTPYFGEDLLHSPDGRAFAARCFKAAIAAKMKAACIAEFRASGLDIQVRFAPGALPHWEALTRFLQRLVDHGA